MDSSIPTIGITINSLNIVAVTFVLFRFLFWQRRHSKNRSFKATWLSYFNLIMYCAFLVAYVDIVRAYIIYSGFILISNKSIIDMTYVGLELFNLLLLYFRLKAMDVDPKAKSFLIFTFVFHMLGLVVLPICESYARSSSETQTKQLIGLIMASLGTLCGLMSLGLEYVMLSYIWKMKKDFDSIQTSGTNTYTILFKFGVTACALNVIIGIICKLVPSISDPNHGEVTSTSRNYEIWYEFGRILTTVYLYVVTSMKMTLARPKTTVLDSEVSSAKLKNVEKAIVSNAKLKDAENLI